MTFEILDRIVEADLWFPHDIYVNQDPPDLVIEINGEHRDSPLLIVSEDTFMNWFSQRYDSDLFEYDFENHMLMTQRTDSKERWRFNLTVFGYNEFLEYMEDLQKFERILNES